MKFKNYYGIDISKDVFDVMDQDGRHMQFANTVKGFKLFLNEIDPQGCFVMEATGVYHVRLADFLYEQKAFVSVVNPLVIKRFIQMNLRRIKTDKADAEMISKYGQSVALKPYKPAPVYVKESRILTDNIDLLIKNRTMLKNRLHALEHKSDKLRAVLIAPLKKTIRDLTVQITRLESELLKLVQEAEGDLLSRLQSIPGVGKSTAMFMIVLSEGFKKFESAKQFTCYVGLSPVEKRSGSSVRGKGSISKQGNGKLRNLLFMCSFNACKSNHACKALYERIVAKGKSKKLALIAVANKLIKQAFAIAKSGLVYDPEYRSVKPC
ncbi:MAG: IS110 family transposase [Cytophagales bacterium]